MPIIRSLKPGEREELYELLGKSFAKDPDKVASGIEMHKAIVESDPFFNYDLNRVIEVDGKLAARIGIYDRTMVFKGNKLRIGAIGGVCTAPEYRGRGFARNLLEDCTTYMENNDFQASLLFGEPAIYGKCGWQTLSAFGISTNFELQTNSKAEIRNVDLDNDWDWLVNIYNRQIHNLTGPFIRTPEYWQKWISQKLNLHDKYSLMIIEKNGVKLGYFSMKSTGDICEIGYDHNITAAFDETVASIFSYVKDKPVRFSFFMQELFDFICDNSHAPDLDMIRKEKFYLSKDAIYCGLFKLINQHKTGIKSTQDLCDILRKENYIFWDMDHF